ncbi:flagellar hook-basal body complex protein [Roseicitreum antarcticum]|uniref:Flagellar basal-body rod protein FlgF n=1 Tax=Roseicitreum antarcticum TaxID=564137 RepID=A0A1H3A335_9RHOB|nr:flagellar hook-basal body complex protein [Roseicitreum antarcticum]SDX23811.1 flagellar basal-body rod protein FlgF [Roseicitreum antarcticum]
MDLPGYTTLTRQSGLMQEMQAVANNIANAATTGFRREGVIFSEFVRRMDDDSPSLSMAAARGRQTFQTQGVHAPTGGDFDLAIEGEGFFLIETPAGERLTRAGNFIPNAAGELVTPDGFRLLDAGGAPVFIPPDARGVAISPDGTVSADGQPLTQIGLMLPEDPLTARRGAGTLFEVDGPMIPVEAPRMMQGFLEGSNVDPITEIARMIAVQRAYELGQSFLEAEDGRQRNVIDTLGS